MLVNFLSCSCTPGTAIQDLSATNCKQNFGPPSKLIFQRIYSSGSTKNSITVASTNPNLLATWTALEAAADGTKVQYSPLIHNIDPSGGEIREYGGGDETIGGIPIQLGSEFTRYQGDLLAEEQISVITPLKQIMCEGQYENLAAYFVNDRGQIGAIGDASTPTVIYPIPIYQFFVSDKITGKRSTPDKNMVRWFCLENWSNNFVVITPSDFNGLTDLKNVA